MKETEVLDECLRMVRASGWSDYKSTYSRVYTSDTGHLMVEFFTDIEKPPLLVSYEEIIFSYSFAEALWGMDTMYFVVHIDKGGMESEVIGWKTEAEMEAAETTLEYYDDMAACEYH